MPDFFLVGAPKCGTTALHAALRAHPSLFMPARKEPHFFGSDLQGRWFLRDPEAYRALFSGAARGAGSSPRRSGEASVFYLCSRRAAREIATAAPAARIVIVLRDPVSVMHALHAQLYFNGNEPEPSFAAALADEPRRLRRVAASHRAPRSPGERHDDRYPLELRCYRWMVDFATQVQRYVDHFGWHRVLVLRYAAWRHQPERVYAELLRFLDVDPRFQPTFAPRNRAKRVANDRLHALLMHPPPTVARPVRALLPARARQAMVRRIQRWNSRPGRPPVDPALQARLRRELRPGIERLEALLGWDLGTWKGGGARGRRS